MIFVEGARWCGWCCYRPPDTRDHMLGSISRFKLLLFNVFTCKANSVNGVVACTCLWSDTHGNGKRELTPAGGRLFFLVTESSSCKWNSLTHTHHTHTVSASKGNEAADCSNRANIWLWWEKIQRCFYDEQVAFMTIRTSNSEVSVTVYSHCSNVYSIILFLLTHYCGCMCQDAVQGMCVCVIV